MVKTTMLCVPPKSDRPEQMTMKFCKKAIADNRILVTLDEHFGDWVVLPLSKHPGVIRLKINPATSQNAIKLLLPFLRLHSSEKYKNHLVILSTKRAKWVHTN